MTVCTRDKRCVGGWYDEDGIFRYRYLDGSIDEGVNIKSNKKYIIYELGIETGEKCFHTFKYIPCIGDIADAIHKHFPNFREGKFNFRIVDRNGDFSKEIEKITRENRWIKV
jgi:hypothetical protein